MLWCVFIATPEPKTYYCALCPVHATKRMTTVKKSGDNYGNLKHHLDQHHTNWKTVIATDQHKTHYEARVELAKGYIAEDNAKRPREETEEHARKLHQKTLSVVKHGRCSMEALARLFCTSPIPFHHLRAESSLRECFNTDCTDVELKEYIIQRGNELLPGKSPRKSASSGSLAWCTSGRRHPHPIYNPI